MGRRLCQGKKGQEMLILILPAMSESPFANSVNDTLLIPLPRYMECQPSLTAVCLVIQDAPC